MHSTYTFYFTLNFIFPIFYSFLSCPKKCSEFSGMGCLQNVLLKGKKPPGGAEQRPRPTPTRPQVERLRSLNEKSDCMKIINSPIYVYSYKKKLKIRKNLFQKTRIKSFIQTCLRRLKQRDFSYFKDFFLVSAKSL